MPTIGQQCGTASDSAPRVCNSADTGSVTSLPPIVPDVHGSSVRHTTVGHHRRMSLETPTSAAFARRINPNFDGTQAKSHVRMRSTAASNRAAASHAALRRGH